MTAAICFEPSQRRSRPGAPPVAAGSFLDSLRSRSRLHRRATLHLRRPMWRAAHCGQCSGNAQVRHNLR